MTRARLRDLGISIGKYPTGPLNAITDVPGVRVGHHTLIHDTPRVARTGVTVIIPRDDIWRNPACAGFHSFNGCGEMTGVHWVEESGFLSSPIALTGTHHVGTAHEALVIYAEEHDHTKGSSLPVVAETSDAWLSDINGLHVKREHVWTALEGATSGPVAEGNVGGGTGMICHDFKGGIGTASRVMDIEGARYTVAALVQANHGDRDFLRIDGVPVGRAIGADRVPLPWPVEPAPAIQAGPTPSSSIIVILATDAPMIPTQCKRLAQRATVGIARNGGVGYNGSGDLFLAFSTGNHVPEHPRRPIGLSMLPNAHLNTMFEAVAEAVEEAILNVLTAAETMTGCDGHTAHALPLDELQRVVKARAG